MDFGEPSPRDELQRLERKVNRLVMLSVAQTVFLAIAVLMYILSLASTYLFWIALLLVIVIVAWVMRDKTPAWVKSLGGHVARVMRTKAEHTTVDVPSTDKESVSSMVG